MEESNEGAMTTSSELSDDNNASCNRIDEDFLKYLSTLTPQQKRNLDEFVSFSDHTMSTTLPSEVENEYSSCALSKFAYGNSVGANRHFGRPMSVYEPFVPENEFSSLPPDLVSSNAPGMNYDFENVATKYWEAEDADYIETLNEMCDNFEHQSTSNMELNHFNVPFLTHTVADIHYVNEKPFDSHIYATVQKSKKPAETQMTTSDRSASDPPREKFPKIMTQSCYGELNNPIDLMWNSYHQDISKNKENIVEDESHHIVSSIMTDSSIIDGVSSMNSSIYEQIPSMTSSTEIQSTAMPRSSLNNQRKIVKWWDDHENAEESAFALLGTTEEGEHKCFISLSAKFSSRPSSVKHIEETFYQLQMLVATNPRTMAFQALT